MRFPHSARSRRSAAPVALAAALLTALAAVLTLLAPGTATAGTFTPDPPTGVTASPGDTVATVNWTPPTSAGATAISKYTVTSSPGGLTMTSTTTKAVVSGLTNGTQYTFTVTATNSVGTSTASVASNAVTPAGVPTAPGSVTPTSGDRQVTLSWTASAANGPGPVAYQVSVDPQVGTTTVNGTTASIVGLSNGTSYSFVVTATNAASLSTSAAAVSSIPAALPAAPFGVNAARGKMSATVLWSAPAANGSMITGYTVTSAPGGVTATTDGSATKATVSGLTDGTSYTFSVTATNGVGKGPASNASNAVVPGETPNPPTGVTASHGDTQATVTWSPPVSTGDPILDYTVTAAPGGATTTVTGTTGTVTGLTNGTTYSFTVTARSQGGSSPASAAASVVPYGLPRQPLSPSVFPGDGTASVSFNPTNGNGSTITSYTVTATPGGGGAPVVMRNALSPVQVTGLVNGTTYGVTVGATNAAGTSTSGPTSVTPVAAVQPVPTPQPPVVVPTGPVVVTLSLDKTFVVNGAQVTASGTVTQGGVAAPEGTLVGINVVYSDGKAVVLTIAATNADGTFSATMAPVYSGTLTASSLGADSAPVPSKVIVSFATVLASVTGNKVTIAAASAPGFFTGPGRAERAQVLLLDAKGKVRKVLAVINASQRHAAAGTQHGVNDLRWTGTFTPGTYRIAIKVIGTPVNTGAQTVTRTVTVTGGVVTPA